MADVFVSYARSDKGRVAPLVAAIEDRGWSVWWDPEITPGQEFDDQIDAEIDKARAVLVVWSPVSVASRWVRGEAREAAERGILVPVRFEQARLPMDVRAIHTTDLDGWNEDPASPQAQEFLRALATMIARTQAAQTAKAGAAAATSPAVAETARFTICVLPFANMSGDPEQEYFSDGISEDIITDLSKVSALWVAARNTTFAFKGKHVDAPQAARQLKVSHLLEGSVRKAGGRVRITAQLIDGGTGGHVWAERYDRELDDIFALQDEISQAIVAALKLKLLPEEKKAIEHRGTTDPEAYKLYLMARQYNITGNIGNSRRSEAIIRLCRRAIEIDPNYARPWAMIASAQINLRFFFGREGDNGLAAAERAIELDANLAEAHAAKSQVLRQSGRLDDAVRENEIALRLDPESYQVNLAAGQLNYVLRRFDQAIRHFEKAATTVETDFRSAGMLVSCYSASGDKEGARRAARRALERCERIVAAEPDNGSAMGFAVGALAALGETERAKEWAERALLLDPDNINLRYNFACTLITDLRDYDAALDLLGPRFETMSIEVLNWVRTDPDLDPIRDHPRFKAMLAAAEARLAQSQPARSP